jgi:biotin transport system substrate-specific component
MDYMVRILTKDIVIKKEIESIIKIFLFSFLMFIGSLIKIYLPWTPVPITLQTFFLFISVYYLNPKEIGISQSIYILAGLIGLPVFAAGLTGMVALIGPTAGYLLGFIIAGVVMALFKEKISNLKIFWLFIFGMIIYLFFGALHLIVFYKISINAALKTAIIPFIPGDILKIIAAYIICMKIRK